MRLPELSVPTYTTELPSNQKKIKYRPYLVKEEKVLLMALQSNKDTDHAYDVTDAVRNLIKSCIITEDVDIDKLPSFDLEWLFLKIRAKSVGEVIEPRLVVPAELCGKGGCKLDVEVNLDKLEVVRNDAHTNTIMLTDEVGVVLSYPTVEGAARLHVGAESSAIDVILGVVTTCVEKVFTNEEVWTRSSYQSETGWDVDIQAMIENMSHEQMVKIKEFFATMPKIKYHVASKCPRCGNNVARDIEGLMDFFS